MMRNDNRINRLCQVLLSGEDALDYSERLEVAFSREAFPEALIRLATDNVYTIRYNVARNPKSPPEALRILDKDGFHNFLAENINTPVDLLQKYFEDKDLWMPLASNPNTPVEILETIGEKSKKKEILKNLANNFKTPAHILTKIAKSKDLFLMSLVAYNPNSDIELSENLIEQVYNKAGSGEKGNVLRQSLARNPIVPDSYIIEWVFGDNGCCTKYDSDCDSPFCPIIGVADNENVDVEILEKLVCSKNPLVLLNLCYNNQTTPEMLNNLYFNNQNDEDIVLGVVRNNKTLEWLLQMIELTQ